jgi:C4-type Zn-finger protein
MKSILTILAFLGLAISSASAGCGITTTTNGKLKSFDKEAKTIVIESEGKEVKTAVKASTKGADGLAALIGKDVTAVISKHGYAESVAAKG